MFVRRGGRLVIALLPRYQVAPRLGGFLTRGGPRPPPMPGTNQPPGVPPALRPPSPQDAGAQVRTVSLQDRWAFSFRQSGLVRGTNGLYQPALARRQAESSLPATWSVRSALYFAKLDPVWRVVYARQESTNEFPVLIERPLGAGAVVLCADSYPFSNESLRRDRQATLLAWFAGHNHRIVFEETHLGARETPGIAAMGREYHLEGVFFAALVLAGLFVWKNAASFMPPYEEQQAREGSEFIAGKDSATGFINLLRRNIAPPDLLKTCLEQWHAQPATPGGPSRSKLEAMQKIIDAENALEPKQRNPVQTYQQFCEILAHRPRFRAPGSTLTGAGSDPMKRSGDHPEDGPANATL
jgi:hypothetical protein